MTVNSISGGKTSAYISARYSADLEIFALVRTSDPSCLYPDRGIRQEVEDRLQMPFIGTLEDDTIIETIFDLEQYIGREIKWVSGETFDDVISNKGGYLPNKVARYCTTYLQTFPIAGYLHEHRLNPVTMRFGFRANEMNRARTMDSKRNENGVVEVKIPVGRHDNGNIKWETVEYQKPEYPLIEDVIYRDTIEEYWNGKPVKFAKHNNCVGCWWRPGVMLNTLNKKHPNKMEWFAKQEEQTGNRFKTETTYRKIIERKLQIQLFEDDFNECDSGYCGI